MPVFLDGLFFSEILADNINTGSNTDGDGTINKSDEFIELQNKAGAAVDLSDYQLWSQTNGLLYDFDTAPAGTATVAGGATATVVGQYTGTPPAGFFDSGDAEGQNFIPDGETVGSNVRADVIYLLNTDTGEYIYLSYGTAELPINPPFPTAGTTLVGGERIATGAPNATAILRDADGDLVEGTPTPGTPGPVCFVSGTMILTDQGDIDVASLKPGMQVLSRDNGYVTLRAMRKAPIGRQILRWHPDVRVVTVPAGVLGNDKPLRISPAHRVLVDEPIADVLFGSSEVLLSARQCVGHMGVSVDERDASITYFHLLFDQHEVINTDGCWSESLFLGDVAHAAIAAASGWDVQDGIEIAEMKHTETARLVLKGFEANLLLRTLDDKNQSAVVAA